MGNITDSIANRLQTKHDYKVEKDGEIHRAAHEIWFNLSFREIADGAIFQIFIKTSSDASPQDVQQYATALNREALLMRFFVDGDGDFACEAYYPGPFSAESFDHFMAAWHNDLATLAQNEMSSRMLS